MWVRGLKPTLLRSTVRQRCVAPHVGAWIETFKILRDFKNYIVAPHVGAWIETLRPDNGGILPKSHPMWVRGLKLGNNTRRYNKGEVAPHVGAWIETTLVKLVK